MRITYKEQNEQIVYLNDLCDGTLFRWGEDNRVYMRLDTDTYVELRGGVIHKNLCSRVQILEGELTVWIPEE